MYLPNRNNGKFLQSKNIYIFFGIFILIFIFNFWSAPSGGAHALSTPFLKLGSHFYSVISGGRNSSSEKNIEPVESEENNALVAAYESLKIQNQKLREQLSMKPEEETLSARIISRFPQIPQDTLSIDKGSSDGVKEEDLVLVGGGVLVGKIVKVSPTNSIVSLNSYPGQISYGYEKITGEKMEISGLGGGNMGFVAPVDFEVEVGDKILAENSELFLASVGIVEEDKALGLKRVTMIFPLDVGKASFVFIKPKYH